MGVLLHYITIMAHLEAERREREKLIPRVLCWYVAPTFGLLRQAWDEMQEFAKDFPGVKFNRGQMRVFLPGDAQIEFKSADNPGGLLSRGLDVVVCTEAARMKREAWQNSLQTRLASPGRGFNGTGGIAILNSTPNGRNWFWELYNSAKNDRSGYMRAWHFTSYDNPGISVKLLDVQRQSLPDRVFRQEYLAEFIEGGGSVFRRVQESLQAYDFPCASRGRVTIGIDWGRYNDRTAIVAIGATGDKYRVLNYDLYNKLTYDAQMRAISAFVSAYPSAQIIAEANSLGDPLIDRLHKETKRKILPFTTTAVTKKIIVEGAATLMEQGAIELPGKFTHGVLLSNARELTDELAQYEVTIGRTGNAAYSAPAGFHDDLVMAFCFALNGSMAKRASGRLEGV